MRDSTSGKIILFGCGIMGHEVLERLGVDNVLCFCDNDISLHGTSRWEKDIVSLDYVKNNYNGFIILICARIDKTYNIACQLVENDIFNYCVYPIVEKYIQDYSTDQLLEFFHNKKLMEKMKMKFYQSKILELNSQLDYMKKHSDIKSLKPARGNLRKRQLALAELGEFVSNALTSSLNIKPFLCAGNLIGHVRHNGFISWDDDLDFGLIRKDYELLWNYCMEQQDENGILTFNYKNKIEKLYFIAGHEGCSLSKEMEGYNTLSTEFFSFDYYREDYLFEDFKKDAKKIKVNACAFQTEEEKNNYLKEEIENNKYVVEKSRLLYYGFDNMGAAELYSKGKFIPEKVLFPLKKIEFEGRQFLIPNEPEEFLTYIYKDIWEFPDDTGIIKHNLASEE